MASTIDQRHAMQFHGVISLGVEASFTLKRQALLFDRLIVASSRWPLSVERFVLPSYLKADVEFLKSKGFLLDSRDLSLPVISVADYLDPEQIHRLWDAMHTASKQESKSYLKESLVHKLEADLQVRSVSAKINEEKLFESVPIYRTQLPTLLKKDKSDSATTMQTVLSVAFEELPVPSQDCAWEDILGFKAETNDKKWGFRRFLQTLATKQQTEPQIRDDIEFTLNEYSKAMDLHRIKSTHSFVEVFLIAPLEILEDLVKFKWSKLAKGVLSVTRRRAEWLEAELKAPGKECAYVFDARKRFGGE